MYAKTSVYICMLLDDGGLPMGAEVIQASNLAQAVDQAAELTHCCTLPAPAHGYELWNRGRKLATWRDLDRPESDAVRRSQRAIPRRDARG